VVINGHNIPILLLLITLFVRRRGTKLHNPRINKLQCLAWKMPIDRDGSLLINKIDDRIHLYGEENLAVVLGCMKLVTS
jgi:hypothetical protein